MRKTRNSRGFTMAEMLIVVAIIAVLGGVAFIAVQNHQRSMAQLERNAVAKELFVAAQNHLTMAETEGYPVEDATSNFFGTPVEDATEGDTTDSDDSTAIDTGKKTANVYYVIGPSSNDILDLMLPFGSIDETVRAGGSYLIHYQTNPARVLDVFYVTTSGSPDRFNKSGGIKTGEYEELMGLRENLPTSGYVLGYYGGEEALESGDIILAPTVEVHNEERLTVTVTDKNKGNANAALKLIIKGETSGAQLAVTLTPTNLLPTNGRFSSIEGTDDIVYTVILDDITTASADSPYDSKIKDGLHFVDLNAFADPNAFAGSTEKVFEFWQEGDKTPTFKPGENLTVRAVAYSNTALTNIAYSSVRITNSLFADIQPVPDTSSSGTITNIKAMIGNFRHLENLDIAVSGLNVTLTGENETLHFTGAEQIVNLAKPETSEGSEEEESTDEDDEAPDLGLSWPGFVQKIKDAKGSDPVKIYTYSSESTGTADDCYRPVDLNYALEYNGNRHKIESVTVDYSQDAGLFGTVGVAGSKAHDLELIDFSIKTSSGDAGALVGKLIQNAAFGNDDENPFNISNVVAYHTDGKADTAKITAASGNGGGLIGQTVGEHFKIEKSAAALIVNSTGGDAGGLIGKAEGGTVIGCYAGGHAIDSPTTNAVIYKPGEYNVTASGNAGGLIGDAGATEISYSYSTCSATGATVGGLIGTGSGAITYSYCTGLVKSTASAPVEGAFVGRWTYTDQDKEDGNWYFDIVNERDEKDGSGKLTGGYTYLDPVPGSPTVSGLTALDESAAQFNEFCPAPTDWNPALPYEATLKAYYGEGSGDKRVARYNLKTVEQLGEAVTKNSGAEGDTTIDDFVATHYGDWPAPEIFVVNTQTN